MVNFYEHAPKMALSASLLGLYFLNQCSMEPRAWNIVL